MKKVMNSKSGIKRKEKGRKKGDLKEKGKKRGDLKEKGIKGKT